MLDTPPSGQSPASGQTPADSQLLVSVRSADEYQQALAAGVDIIDFKEPTLGPLAPVDPEFWREIARQPELLLPSESGRSVSLSAALGESADAVLLADQVPGRFAFAKVGPSGCLHPQQLLDLWQNIRNRLDDSVELVAVAYADHQAAECLDVSQVIGLAAEAGFRRCLIDTYRKNGRSTLEVLGIERLQRIQRQVREHQLWWALAGSLRLSQLSTLRASGLSPNCLGLRGDVCDDGRTSGLCPQRLRLWCTATRGSARPVQSGQVG